MMMKIREIEATTTGALVRMPDEEFIYKPLVLAYPRGLWACRPARKGCSSAAVAVMRAATECVVSLWARSNAANAAAPVSAYTSGFVYILVHVFTY